MELDKGGNVAIRYENEVLFYKKSKIKIFIET